MDQKRFSGFQVLKFSGYGSFIAYYQYTFPEPPDASAFHSLLTYLRLELTRIPELTRGEDMLKTRSGLRRGISLNAIRIERYLRKIFLHGKGIS